MFGSAPLDTAEHTMRPWRIHAIAREFRVLDVWPLPTPGGRDDFPRLVRLMATLDPANTSVMVRTLFAVRWALGRLFGLDDQPSGLGARVPSLRDRLPAELADLPTGFDTHPFTPLYVTDDEFALEIANQTVHGVMHIGWVPDQTCGHRGQLTVLVKPNGALGTAYLAAISPFRHFIVYPLMLRDIGRAWRQATAETRR
ncbi:DUF2867 domain-containing protein [Mycobacterium sp. NPDC048908]|uniref:DUF2867 domain-containing protein n=1 Tax=Mycobacterium sp. NPDC048908 TaxID=3364292 RepID=UPI00371C080B